MRTLVGLTGRKRSGKDTAALGLNSLDFQPISFAKPIKDMLRALLKASGVPPYDIDRMIEGDLKETPSAFLGGKTPRYAMQTLGTEWGRGLMSDNLWIDAALFNAEAIGGEVVITDVRFPNELAAIRDAGGVVLRVERPDRPVGVGEDHPSETQIDSLPVDYVVVNDKTVEDLQFEVRRIVSNT